MAELVHGLTAEQLRMQVNAGKWSVQQNIAHLAAYQPVFLARIQEMQHQHEPRFERYVADNDPLFLEACEQTVEVLLQQVREYRNTITDALLALNDSGLRRTAIHTHYGKMDVTRWAEFFLLHEAHHLFTIFKLAADLRKG